MSQIPRIATQIGYHLSFFPQVISVFYLNFFDCFETYNANGWPASFGLSKTSMHFAISFCFCSVGFTRLGLALFYWNLNSASPFAPHLPALALSFDDWLWVSIRVLLVPRSAFFHEWPGAPINVVSTLGTLCFTFLRQFSPMLWS